MQVKWYVKKLNITEKSNLIIAEILKQILLELLSRTKKQQRQKWHLVFYMRQKKLRYAKQKVLTKCWDG